MNVTVLVPEESYRIPNGFSVEDTAGVALGPKSQAYNQGLPELPVLLKLIGELAHCGAFEVNVAVGV